MNLLIRRKNNGEWQVWVGPTGDHPVHGLGFIVASAQSRDAAIEVAVTALERQVEALQSPDGAVSTEYEKDQNVYVRRESQEAPHTPQEAK